MDEIQSYIIIMTHIMYFGKNCNIFCHLPNVVLKMIITHTF